MHREGVIQKVMRNQVEVVIESLGYMLVATIHKRNVQPI